MTASYLYSDEHRQQLCDSLQGILADYVIFTLKTQHVHWNVVGMNFLTIHKLTESQYKDLQTATDEIAERIRALGGKALGSFQALKPHASLSDDLIDGDAHVMLNGLLEGHLHCTQTAAKIRAMAADIGDDVTADMMNDRVAEHESQAWVIRSLLSP